MFNIFVRINAYNSTFERARSMSSEWKLDIFQFHVQSVRYGTVIRRFQVFTNFVDQKV